MKKHFILSIILLSSTPIIAQQKLSPEKLWQLGRVAGNTINTQKKEVIYTVTKVNLEENKSTKNTYALSLENSKQKLINKPEESISDIQILENKVYYLKNDQLWACDLNYNNHKQISHIEGGIANAKLSPNGKYLLFTQDVLVVKTEANAIYTDLPKANAYVFNDLNYRHWDTWTEGKFSHVFVADIQADKVENIRDIMENEPYDSPQKPFGGAEDVIWAADSKSILYVCKKKFGKEYATSTNTDIYQYNIQSKATRNLTQGMMGYDTQPAFNEDGSLLAWTSMSEDGYESDKNDIVIWDIAANKKYNLTKNWDESVVSFNWSKDAKKIFFTAFLKGTQQVYQIDLQKELSQNTAKHIKQLTSGAWDINAILGQYKNQLIVNKTDINHSAELFYLDISSGKLAPLTHVNDEEYKNIALSKVEERWVKTTDGKDMLTWVIYPPDFDPAKKYPTLLYCQGGPQSAVSQFYSVRWNFQLMAAQGYIVIAPNRRGLPGFGVEWNKQISGDWGGQAMKDYLSAIDDVSKEPFVDKNRLGCVGASYGGYSVYMLAGIHQNRFKTFIAHNGLFDLRSWYGTTEELFFANKDVGGSYWQENAPAAYKTFSPSEYVKNWNTPILIFQGGKDFRVPIEQGLQAYQVAQLKGIKSRLVFFPEENHWVLKPQNGIVWQREFFNWLKETL
ncbi:S9 family peptidase [Pseudopedobacter beijingensis]|uniref:S9 family peptidase n=1 Tax=Pseudopedobacter beijingensis TaxID=1207056 RepID=A0ABW4IGK6_9SPHI